IPNGRAVPACYDRFTGKLRYFQLSTRAGGDHVVLGRDAFFNDGVAFDLQDGKPRATIEKATCSPAMDGDTAYAAMDSQICAFDLAHPASQTSKLFRGPKQRYLPNGTASVAGMD